jgi:phospholipid N-methyltransferase
MPRMLAFLRAFVRDPVTIGAVAPSGADLAALTVSSASIGPGHVVVELGAGTGPMTAELLRAHADAPLLVLEPTPALAADLRARFPAARVLERPAQDLPALVSDWGHPAVDRVVSSLPWAIWPERLQDEVFDAVQRVMHADGRLVTFSYVHTRLLPPARRFRALLHRRFRTVTTTRVAWCNLPPAFVYVCDGPRGVGLSGSPPDTGR